MMNCGWFMFGLYFSKVKQGAFCRIFLIIMNYRFPDSLDLIINF
jgi:hypothetical protein